MEELLVAIFLIIVFATLLCFLLTSVSLFRIATHSETFDTRWLGMSYICMVALLLYFIIAESFVYFFIISFTVYLFADIFVHKAFYKDRKSPVKIIIFLHLLIAVVRTFLLSVIESNHIFNVFDLIISNVGAMLGFGWLAIAARKTHLKLVQYKVQPWVQKKAAIVSHSSFIGMLLYIPDLITTILQIPYQDTSNPASMVLFGLSFICLFVFAIGQYLAWVMPAWFKRRLNHSFFKKQFETEELSEDEILLQMAEGDNSDV